MEIDENKLPIMYRKRHNKTYFYLLYIQVGHILWSDVCNSYFVCFRIIHETIECKDKWECDRVIKEKVKEFLIDVLTDEEIQTK